MFAPQVDNEGFIVIIIRFCGKFVNKSYNCGPDMANLITRDINKKWDIRRTLSANVSKDTPLINFRK